MEKLSIPALANKIATEGDAYVFMERMRWGAENERLACPHCGNGKAYFLNPANGVNRKTRTGAASERRVWKCAACRKQFSVTTGTIFHGSKVPLRTWLFVVFQMCASKNGVSAREVERTYGLTPKTAWFVLHRIREAMKREPLAGMLSGTVVADESWIGGKPKNKHQQGKPRPYSKGGDGRGGRANPFENKTPILSLISQDTGEVRTVVVNDVTGNTLRKAMSDHVDMPNTTLHTDAAGSYRKIAAEFAGHRSVDHQDREYVRTDPDGVVVTTNHAEGYFSQLKRSLDGTHHHVSRQHLARYLAEFDYRYSTRSMGDTERMNDLFGKVAGKRLTYRPATDRA